MLLAAPNSTYKSSFVSSQKTSEAINELWVNTDSQIKISLYMLIMKRFKIMRQLNFTFATKREHKESVDKIKNERTIICSRFNYKLVIGKNYM
jgi:hypothetical protein